MVNNSLPLCEHGLAQGADIPDSVLSPFVMRPPHGEIPAVWADSHLSFVEIISGYQVEGQLMLIKELKKQFMLVSDVSQQA